MPPRRWLLGSRFSSGPLLALWASCLWGCPQLLSDDFGPPSSVPDLTGQIPSVLDTGNATGGAAGEAGSSGSSGHAGSSGSSGSSGHAGSAGSTGSPPPPPNPPDAGGADDTPLSNPGAPSVVNVSPSDGATGVAADAVVTVTFSESMNTTTVETAYSSTDLPKGSVSFNWSNGDTVLEITPNAPLTIVTGSNPVARSYAFTIGSSAVDLQGEALPSFSSSFSTLRGIPQTLTAVQNRTLTGNYRSDDVYGDNSCVQAGSTTTCVGDSSNANSTYRGFVTFDLSGLPAETQGLSSAQLTMSVDNIHGSPSSGLGNLLAEHVSFDSISLDAFQAAPLGSAIPVSGSYSVSAQLSADLLSSVQGDLAARGYSQFRFRFSIATNTNGAGDLIEVTWDTEQLAVTCLVP
jgi:hypothetical protein